MAIRYVFRDSVIAFKEVQKADPQKIGEALEAITVQGGGELTPRAVVDAARAPRHVLHRHFEWDNAKAAEAYRLEQARSIIRSINAEDASIEDESAPAFISISDRSGTSYRRLADVQVSVDLQARVMQSAERDLIAFETRYKALLGVCDLVRKARERLAEERSKAAPQEIRPS